MGFFDIFKSTTKPIINLDDLKFISDNHIRYENNRVVSDQNQNAYRGIRITRQQNNTYIVSIYIFSNSTPVWGSNFQMSPKVMEIIEQNENYIKFRGIGTDQLGNSFADYGLIITFQNGVVIKCILQLLDRNTNIEYKSSLHLTSTTENKSSQRQSIFVNGDKYVGEYFNNKPHGKGEYIFAQSKNLIKYIGEFNNGFRDGFGSLFFIDGTIYEGNFIDDQANGKGKYTYEGGTVYEGDIKDGKWDGYGILKFPSGEISIGYFKENMLHGQVKTTFPNREIYEGEYLYNKRNGFGKYSYPDGEYYEGNFINGKYEGKGKYKYADGRLYVGEFKNDLFHGFGVYYDSNGNINKAGFWSCDNFVG